MESLIGLLPLLILLACPLIMGLCFWGMRRMGGETDTAVAAAEPVAASVDQNLPLSERIALLQGRLDQLKTEQDAIAGQLAELAWMEAAENESDQAQNRPTPSIPDATTTGLDT